MRVNYVITFVSDMKRSTMFYRDMLGMNLRFESPGWTEFATDGATVVLHSTPRSDFPGHDSRSDIAGRCRPGLRVENLDEFHKKMVERNVPCIQEPREVFGARVAQYMDPDGLVISIGEETHGR